MTVGPLNHSTSRLGRIFRRLGASTFTRAMDDNLYRISKQLRDASGDNTRILDLGCWDGSALKRIAPPTAEVYGIEIDAGAAKSAFAASLQVIQADLNSQFPWRSESFDIVTSNQVIEHLYDTDSFLAESYRVLRQGGLIVVSTENLSSWHNILALVLGWQAFSLTNVTSMASGLGNPLANLRHEEPFDAGWQHLRLFSYRGLKELVLAHGFGDPQVFGAGYYPFPSAFGRLDPRHAAFMTAVARKR